MPKYNPKRFFFFIAVILVIAALVLFWRTHLNIFYAYLISVSVITFIFYGYDKRQAIKGRSRVPEVIMHMLALLSGTPGAFLGQLVFRHKTKKLKFQIVFIAIVLFQVGLGFCYWSYWR